jgi:hypothetical protein
MSSLVALDILVESNQKNKRSKLKYTLRAYALFWASFEPISSPISGLSDGTTPSYLPFAPIASS